MLASAVSQEELVQVLHRSLASSRSNMGSIKNIDRRRSDYQSSFRLEEVSVEFEDGTSQQLLLKDVSHGARSNDALLARSRIAHDPLRELGMYDRVLSPARLGPTVYATVVDAEHDRYWLLLEKVDGVELYQAGTIRVWQACARWLARFHARFVETERLANSLPLLLYDRVRSESDFAFLLESDDAALRSLARELKPTYRRVLDLVYLGAQTLLHGDFYASNVLVRDEALVPDVVPVDWEMAGIGPNLLDLAALISGRWSSSERTAIASAYYLTWLEEHGHEQSLSSFLVTLDCARLVVAMRWLTTSSAWSPPQDHARDWYADAREVACDLGLLPSRARPRS